MYTTQSRQKNYANVRHRNLEFKVGDKVFFEGDPNGRCLEVKTKGQAEPLASSDPSTFYLDRIELVILIGN